MPKLCRVEQIALKFMFDCYDKDSRYTIEPEERERISKIIQQQSAPWGQDMSDKHEGAGEDAEGEKIDCNDHFNKGGETAAQL